MTQAPKCFICGRPATVNAAVGCDSPVARWRCDEHRRVCETCRYDDEGEVIPMMKDPTSISEQTRITEGVKYTEDYWKGPDVARRERLFENLKADPCSALALEIGELTTALGGSPKEGQVSLQHRWDCRGLVLDRVVWVARSYGGDEGIGDSPELALTALRAHLRSKVLHEQSELTARRARARGRLAVVGKGREVTLVHARERRRDAVWVRGAGRAVRSVRARRCLPAPSRRRPVDRSAWSGARAMVQAPTHRQPRPFRSSSATRSSSPGSGSCTAFSLSDDRRRAAVVPGCVGASSSASQAAISALTSSPATLRRRSSAARSRRVIVDALLARLARGARDGCGVEARGARGAERPPGWGRCS